MARGISGWTLDDLLSFLKCHNFSFYKELAGSHEVWANPDFSLLVEVNRTHGTYRLRTLETMISNSGLDKEHWKKWTTLGSTGKKRGQCCPK